jgi:hypothetical protein
MNKRDDVPACEGMYSPFEKQLCDHKQVIHDIFRVKEGDSKKRQIPKYFDDAPSDCKMPKVPVQEGYTIGVTTPISKSIIYGKDVVPSDFKKDAPSIEGNYSFSEATKSKGLMDEEVQFVMSHIESEKESRTKKRKTEIPTYEFQTPLNVSLQRRKFLFETSIHSSNINSKKQSGLAGKAGIHTSG